MQTLLKVSLRNDAGLSDTTCWTLNLVLRYSTNLFKKLMKCSALRMLPGTASTNMKEINNKTLYFHGTKNTWLKIYVTYPIIFQSFAFNVTWHNQMFHKIIIASSDRKKVYLLEVSNWIIASLAKSSEQSSTQLSKQLESWSSKWHFSTKNKVFFFFPRHTSLMVQW